MPHKQSDEYTALLSDIYVVKKTRIVDILLYKLIQATRTFYFYEFFWKEVFT